MKAFWTYYRTVNLFNIFFTLIVAFGASRAYVFPILFCTVGIAVGIFSFNYFFSNQYYLYYNLGYSKSRLATLVFLYNLGTALPLLLLILIF